jgi:hypothetical protein
MIRSMVTTLGWCSGGTMRMRMMIIIRMLIVSSTIVCSASGDRYATAMLIILISPMLLRQLTATTGTITIARGALGGIIIGVGEGITVTITVIIGTEITIVTVTRTDEAVVGDAIIIIAIIIVVEDTAVGTAAGEMVEIIMEITMEIIMEVTTETIMAVEMGMMGIRITMTIMGMEMVTRITRRITEGAAKETVRPRRKKGGRISLETQTAIRTNLKWKMVGEIGVLTVVLPVV